MDPDNKIFLLPGELTFSRKPTTISTLLGSCVAICIHDTKNKWGGMNHFMLPNKRPGLFEDGKFGDASTDKLLKAAMAAGAKKEDLVCSIYGGGQVVGHLGSMQSTGAGNIGEQNIAIAKKLMKEHGIPIVKEEVSGKQGRRISMDTVTNEIVCKLIERSQDAVNREKVQEKLQSGAIKVLLVDDSETVRKLIRQGLEDVPGIEVVGEAENPFEARSRILEVDPDVMCLDIIMPKMDGHTFLKKIMQYKPIPTVIVSTITKAGSRMEQNVLEAGAIEVLDKETMDLYRRKDGVKELLVPKIMKAARTIMPPPQG